MRIRIHAVKYVAGWNMPGYIPESEPALFLDANDALEYIKDSAKQSIDETEEPDERFKVDIETMHPDIWEADSNGEFGFTFGKFHYFVSRI